MGLTWAVALSAAGAVPHWLFGFTPDAPMPILFGLFGFVAGVTFAGILALTEGRRNFGQMSMPRFALWGGLGGFLLSGAWTRIISLNAPDALGIALAFTAASAACAAGSLALARRAERRELADAGKGGQLTDYEKQKLL
jgi:hypothetical protein